MDAQALLPCPRAVFLGLIFLSAAVIGAEVPTGADEAGSDRAATAEFPAAAHLRDSSQGSVVIKGVPFLRQKPDFCGEACAAMVLRKLGQPVDQDYVFDQSGLDPKEARGCHTKELAAALVNIGFRVGDVWYTIPAAEAAEYLERQWQAMYADLAAGVPSIVCMHYSEQPGASEHFRLVLGYDAQTDEIIYHEPAEDDGEYRHMARREFLKLWPLKYQADRWTLIRLRLEPGRLKPGKTADGLTGADYAQHLMKVIPKLPSDEFSVVIAHPFVVIGDEPPTRVKSRAEGTVKWAVDKLKEAYFAKDPAEILDIWLFQDKTSYERHAAELFHTRPTTPFGYCSHEDRALVMNIATGGGTLVHEIVHAFMTPNFPDCPAWFNEGLASLYEQCGEEGGQIHGYTNWRLAGLQEAIRAKEVPSFKTLCSTSSRQFYEEDAGSNYAQARYLCYYLQQQGLLQKFYRQFRANCKRDPTGYDTLQAVLGRDDMEKFKKDWETYVLRLTFP